MRSAPRLRFLLPAGARILIGACACASGWAHAQVSAQPTLPGAARPATDAAPPSAVLPAPRLQASPQLSESLPADKRASPTFVFGRRVSGQPDVQTVIEGNAEVRRSDTAIRADRLEIEAGTQLLTSQGQVRVQTGGNVFVGTELELQLDTVEGFFTQPRYRLRNGGNGEARRIEFLGEQRFRAVGASYTSCDRNDEATWNTPPAWELTGQSFDFDMQTETGTVRKPVLRFKDVPILAWGGSLSFPLSDKRKSGFLPPSYFLDTTSGFSLLVPYYLDIAPNRDATISPMLRSKRGLDLGTEFRYLERNYQGLFRSQYLPNDNITGEDRWSYSMLHSGRATAPVAGGGLSYSLNLNRVSDGSYWRDFPRQPNRQLTQRLLPADAVVSWGRGPWALGFRALSWQTQQTPDSVITPPYDRLPQITARYGLTDRSLGGLTGIEGAVDTDFTRFQALRRLTSQTNADRLVTRLQISRSWATPAAYVTPRVQLHATQYNFTEEWRGTTTASRLVPTFSLDSGLQFERDARFLGSRFVQTLEPRAFYVYTPFRDQTRLPNYDSAESGFTFASLFTENTFLGNDRIADANLLTLGVTSRLLDADTGADRLRLGVAQRVRFADQRVTLGGQPPPVNAERLSDLLLGATVNWTREWSANVFTQYSPELGESRRTAVGARYTPTPYRVLTAAFRRQQPLTPTATGSQQLDVGWQWPINDLWGDRGQDLGPGRGLGGRRWYSVGRLNYSMLDRRLVDGVLGVEYDGCCWIGRLVLQRSTLGLATANTQIMFQLEFIGLSRIGNNPLTTLRNQIPRYQMLRDQVSMPSRFTNYE